VCDNFSKLGDFSTFKSLVVEKLANNSENCEIVQYLSLRAIFQKHGDDHNTPLEAQSNSVADAATNNATGGRASIHSSSAVALQGLELQGGWRRPLKASGTGMSV
jgi:metal-dependent HD superfamily phosphatase/phosphodiesterase